MKGSVSITGGSQYTYDKQDTKLAYQHNLLLWSKANCISVPFGDCTIQVPIHWPSLPPRSWLCFGFSPVWFRWLFWAGIFPGRLSLDCSPSAGMCCRHFLTPNYCCCFVCSHLCPRVWGNWITPLIAVITTVTVAAIATVMFTPMVTGTLRNVKCERQSVTILSPSFLL